MKGGGFSRANPLPDSIALFGRNLARGDMSQLHPSICSNYACCYNDLRCRYELAGNRLLRVREECHKNRHERYPRYEERHVFAVGPALARGADRVRNEVMKYDNKIRTRSEAKQRHFDGGELFEEKVPSYRADEYSGGNEKIVDKRGTRRKAGAPQDEKFRYFLQHLVHEDAHGTRDAEEGRGGECGDDDDTVPDVMYPVTHENAVCINLRVRVVGFGGVVVVVKMREIAKSHKYQDGARDNPGKTSRERPRVFDNFLGEGIRGDEKNARREAHKKVQIALDKRPRLPPRNELPRKRGEHDEE